jgi:CRP-like cAMP-binding protein
MDLCDVREFQPHETIFQQGDPGRGFYVLTEGVVEVTRVDDQGIKGHARGTPQVLATLQTGTYFGEMVRALHDMTFFRFYE